MPIIQYACLDPGCGEFPLLAQRESHDCGIFLVAEKIWNTDVRRGVILPSSCPFKATAGTVSTATIWETGIATPFCWPSAPIRISAIPPLASAARSSFP